MFFAFVCCCETDWKIRWTMAATKTPYWDVIMHILRYLEIHVEEFYYIETWSHRSESIKLCWLGWIVMDRRSTVEYCVYVGGNFVSWKTKKPYTVSSSSFEVEHRAIAQMACEVWLKQILLELGFDLSSPRDLLQQSNCLACFLKSFFFMHTLKCWSWWSSFSILRDTLKNVIETSYLNFEDQLVDLFTKLLGGQRLKVLVETGIFDISAQLECEW